MYVTITDPDCNNSFAQALPQRLSVLPRRRLAAEHHLFREGDRVEYVYQVVSGAVRLSRLLEDGRRQIIAFGFPGDIVGFPCNGRHHTDCEALDAVELQPYRLSRLEDCAGHPELNGRFLRAALREIAAMQDHFMMLGRKSASEKVASFLSVLADRIGLPVGHYVQVKLPMSRSDIADFLGLTTETVSRTLSQLRKRGIIAIEGIHTVLVLRPETLLAVANGYPE